MIIDPNYGMQLPELGDSSNINVMSNNFATVSTNLKAVSDLINTHLASFTAHDDTDISNTSGVSGAKVRDALITLNNQISNHINSITAHASQNISVTSSDPSLSGVNDVLEALEYLQTEINNLIIESGTSDAETINARLSSIYGSFVTLKERLDNTDDRVKTLEDAVNTSNYGTITLDKDSTSETVTDAYAGMTKLKSAKGVTLYNPPKTWKTTASSLIVTDNLLTVTGNGVSLSPGIYCDVLSVNSNNYVLAWARVTNSDCVTLRATLQGLGGGTLEITSPIQNRWYPIYGIKTLGSTTPRLLIEHRYADAATTSGKVMEINNSFGVMSIKLTGTPQATYTVEQMNTLIGNGFKGLESNNQLTMETRGNQLFNKLKTTYGYYFGSDGLPIASSTSFHTDYINVIPGKTYSTTNVSGSTQVVEYDKSKNIIGRTYNDSNLTSFSCGNNTYSVRLSYYTAGFDTVNTLMINEGLFELPYESYVGGTKTITCTNPSLFENSQVPNGTQNEIGVDNIGIGYAIKNNDNLFNIGQYVTDIYTGYTTLDVARIPKASFVGALMDGVSGRHKVDGRLEITSDFDNANNLYGFYTSTSFMWIYIPKGTTLNDAKTFLANETSVYQLAVPQLKYEKDFADWGIVVEGALPSIPEHMEALIYDYDILGEVEVEYPRNISQAVSNNTDAIVELTKETQDNTYKIADIEQVIGAYGVKWNETDDVWTRLGQATSTTNWDNVFPYSNIRRCNVADNGTVLAYYGDPNYIEDGTNGQVMVEYPKYYSKYLYYTIGGKTYHEWWVSGTNYTGMEVDPMFRKGDSYTEYTYVSAYEGSIYDVSASSYLLADEQIADFTATTGDKLSSIAGAKPCSGLTQDLTIVKSRILANNRGNGWGLMNGLQVAGIQHLFMIEYGHANSQTAIGLGVVNKASGTVNESNITGATSFLGNSSGREAGTDGLTSVSYRGLENLWGNIWSWVDGINIQADNKLWMNLKNENFVSDSFVEPYYKLGTLSNANGYVSKLLGSKYGMFATQSTGSSSTRIPDYYYQSTGNRVAPLGGLWFNGSTAGFACWDFSNVVSYRSRVIGARCAFF